MRKTMQKIQTKQPSFINCTSTPSAQIKNQISDSSLFECTNDAPSNIERDLESGKGYLTLKSGYPPRYGTCNIGLLNPDCVMSVL